MGSARGPLDPADHRARVGAGPARLDGGQHRARAHRRRVRRELRGPAVDDQRLHAHPRRADPARRLAGRPLRPSPDLRHRRGVVRGRLGALRARAVGGVPHRRARAAGRRRRAADPGEPGADLGVVPRQRPRRGDRRVVGPRAASPGRSARSSAASWSSGPGARCSSSTSRSPWSIVVVALRHVPESRDPQAAPPPRRARHRARRRRARGADLGADRGGRGRGHPGGDRHRSGGRARPRRVRPRRAALAGPARARRAVRQPTLHRRQRRHPARLRGARRELRARRAPAAGGRRVQPARGRHGDAADHRDHAAALGPLGASGAADRAALADDGRAPARRDAGCSCCGRIGAGASYFVDVLPAVALFGLGLAATVAPLTATVLDAADDRHVGIASGVNNADRPRRRPARRRADPGRRGHLRAGLHRPARVLRRASRRP